MSDTVEVALTYCEWDEDENEVWTSSCGQEYIYTSPVDLDFGFCPYCGKELVYIRYDAYDFN